MSGGSATFATALTSSSASTIRCTTGRRRDEVAFGLLVESGLVPPGTRLMDSQRRWKADVRADASLSCGPHAGSIHKVGAGLNKAPSCNGWTFWHVEREGGLLLLDTLRGQIRAEMAAA